MGQCGHLLDQEWDQVKLIHIYRQKNLATDYMEKLPSMNNVPEIEVWKSPPREIGLVLQQDANGDLWPRRVKVFICFRAYTRGVTPPLIYIYIYIYIIYIYIDFILFFFPILFFSHFYSNFLEPIIILRYLFVFVRLIY